MSRLDRIEKHIRNIFEKSPALLPWVKLDNQVARHLTESLQALFNEKAPREYLHPKAQFTLNPATAARWRAQPGWNEILAELLLSTAAEYGSRLRTWPEITVKSNAALSEEEIVITLFDALPAQGGETGIISLESLNGNGHPVDATGIKPVLILHGGRVVELSLPVINIGRKSSNHIIISDPRVSRNHTQLRKIKDEYMVFDTGSSGGTFVNSERIQSHVLRPGDVISLAGFTMIFTIDQTATEDTKKSTTAELKTTNEEEE